MCTEGNSSFATVASKRPATIPTPSVKSSLSMHQTMPVRQPMQLGSRDLNVVLFGLPESGSIVDDKHVVDKALEFIVNKALDIRDIMFRLGKFSKTASRPRPLLVKVSSAWDQKLILLHKSRLRDFRITRLFVCEDVPPEHKLCQRRSRSLTASFLPPTSQASSLPPTSQASSILPTSQASSLPPTSQALFFHLYLRSLIHLRPLP